MDRCSPPHGPGARQRQRRGGHGIGNDEEEVRDALGHEWGDALEHHHHKCSQP